MRNQHHDHTIDRRKFLGKVSLAAAAATPIASSSQGAESQPKIRLAQAGAAATGSSSAVAVKAAEHVAGSTINHAYAVKAGNWIFLNGHEAYDFEKGLSPEVEGQPGYALSGRPPLRREADYIIKRMRTILKEFGADLANTVRVDQFYTHGAAVSAYHLARFAEFGGYIAPSTSIIMERCFTGRTNTHTALLAAAPGPGWDIEKITPPGRAISASGYFPAVTVNDFVFVAGNMATGEDGELPPSVRLPANRRWGGQTSFRRQVQYCVKERLEPSLKAAGSSLENCLKAQAYVRGVENFPDFMEVWSQLFRNIPCAVTVVPAKDYANTDGSLEVNLIALKNGARRRKQVVPLDIPPLATFGPCVRAGELVFPSGMMAVGRDGLVPAADQASAFEGLGLAGQAQGVMLMSYVDAICKAVNVPIRNVVRAQYFLGDMRHFTGIAAAWSDRYGKTPHPFACVQVPVPLPATAAAAIADFWVYAG